MTVSVIAPARTVLHLGCGRVGRRIGAESDRVISIDVDPRVQPDLVCRLGVDRIPLPDDSVDEAVAIHVLEHIGHTGDTVCWFRFWEDLYRVLRPGGTLRFESPLWSSVWAWADPGHVRALSPQSFGFLAQENYRTPGSPITPYRVRCDFEPAESYERVADATLLHVEPYSHFRGLLRAVKPLRPWWEG